MTQFERIGGEEVWSGKIASVHVDRFRYHDGSEKEREIVRHPGAVVIVAHDGEHVYLITQPREAVGERALLELPAGKLDEAIARCHDAKSLVGLLWLKAYGPHGG